MLVYLYFVGLLVSFILCAYFDAKGLAFINFKPRSEIYNSQDRLFFVSIGSFFWPISLIAFVTYFFYSGLVYVFSRVPKKSRIWSCPMIKSAVDYRNGIERCSVMTKSVKIPKCDKHHCNMVEET